MYNGSNIHSIMEQFDALILFQLNVIKSHSAINYLLVRFLLVAQKRFKGISRGKNHNVLLPQISNHRNGYVKQP